jgi:hypothetical protein
VSALRRCIQRLTRSLATKTGMRFPRTPAWSHLILRRGSAAWRKEFTGFGRWRFVARLNKGM